MNKKTVPPEALISLRVRLEQLPSRSLERKELIERTANLYGVSRSTLYRSLNDQPRPKSARRADFGLSRKIPKGDLERYCEVIAALIHRTTNKKGHHISTAKAIEIIEQYGVDSDLGFIKAPPGLLDKSLVNRQLKALSFDRKSLKFEPPCVRFQAEESNDCWQFDLSQSDLKEVDEPSWIAPGRGAPTLTLFSMVDDRSGANYTEYWSVYGEEVETALRFLYNAMAPKKTEGFLMQGIPKMIYTDNGPIRKSNVFKRVLFCLGIDLKSHEPRKNEKIGQKTTSRGKGKVERPFRTVKSAHEALYQLHQPKNETEANEWMMRYLVGYNAQTHRTEDHSRMEDWVAKLPEEGFKAVCSWEKFCSFAREHESKKVDRDATISMDDGVRYEVSPELVDERVIVWWGLFDNELYVEHNEQRYGPYKPSGGPIPLHTYRRHKKTKREKRAERIETLAKNLSVPRAVLSGKSEDSTVISLARKQVEIASVPYVDRFQFEAPDFDNQVLAKLAVSQYLGRPIAELSDDAKAFIFELVASTLNKQEVIGRIKTYFAKARRRGEHRAH